MADRQALHAYLSEDAHRSWNEFAQENGVSVTGMLEALGLNLGAEIDKAVASGGDATDVRPDWVKAGRKIDVSRRRRSRD